MLRHVMSCIVPLHMMIAQRNMMATTLFWNVVTMHAMRHAFLCIWHNMLLYIILFIIILILLDFVEAIYYMYILTKSSRIKIEYTINYNSYYYKSNHFTRRLVFKLIGPDLLWRFIATLDCVMSNHFIASAVSRRIPATVAVLLPLVRPQQTALR